MGQHSTSCFRSSEFGKREAAAALFNSQPSEFSSQLSSGSSKSGLFAKKGSVVGGPTFS
jgi:hypothetical protein